ncbi:MAG: hypothetical protein ACLUTU_00435 [Blautia faecis]
MWKREKWNSMFCKYFKLRSDVLNYAIADNILYYALYPEEVPQNVDLFGNRILQCPHDIRFAMGLTIDDVAKLSPTVNTQHYFRELRF